MTKSYCLYQSAIILNVVQSLSRVQLFGMPWTAALQASLSFTISRSLLRFMSIESVMLSNHFILCRSLHILPSIFPSIRVFSNELAFHLRGQSIGVSASASVLPMNIQSWFSLGLTGLISLKSKGLSRVFSSTTNSEGSILHHSPFLLPNKPPETQNLNIINNYSCTSQGVNWAHLMHLWSTIGQLLVFSWLLACLKWPLLKQPSFSTWYLIL